MSNTSEHTSPRPLILVFIVISFTGSGLLGWMLGIGLQFGMGFAESLSGGLLGGAFGSQMGALLLAVLAQAAELLGVFFMAAAYGLWSFQRWGKPLANTLLSISVIVGVISFLMALLSRERSLGMIFNALAGVLVYAFLWMKLSVLNLTGVHATVPESTAGKLFCTQCGAPAADGNLACTNCGARLK